MPENELATKKDLNDQKEELLQRLVRKEDFDQQIAKLATKEELKQEVAKLATRDALEVVANQVAKNTLEIAEMKSDIKELRYDIKELRHDVNDLRQDLNDKFDTILTAVDGIAKELVDMRTEKVTIDNALRRHEDWLEDHDKRIRKLELKKAS